MRVAHTKYEIQNSKSNVEGEMNKWVCIWQRLLAMSLRQKPRKAVSTIFKMHGQYLVWCSAHIIYIAISLFLSFVLTLSPSIPLSLSLSLSVIWINDSFKRLCHTSRLSVCMKRWLGELYIKWWFQMPIIKTFFTQVFGLIIICN